MGMMEQKSIYAIHCRKLKIMALSLFAETCISPRVLITSKVSMKIFKVSPSENNMTSYYHIIFRRTNFKDLLYFSFSAETKLSPKRTFWLEPNTKTKT